MPIRALDVANYFIGLSADIDENDLTNLKLQKLLYFSQGKYLARYHKELFKEKIEAWELGPVVREVYDKFKVCGNFPITAFDIQNKLSDNLDKKTQEFLLSVWDEYGKYAASFLVEKTHRRGSPWKKYYSKGENIIIPNSEMEKYFSKAII